MPVTPSYALPLARALSVALLTLALLSSIIPIAALSSSHSCAMPCCAGVDGGCETGACQGALFKSPKKEEKEEEKLCGSEAAYKSHGRARKARKAAPADSSVEADHCDSEHEKAETANQKATAARSEITAGERQSNSVSARVVAAPCAKDCCAAAGPSSQSRRGRDSALASLSGKSPPTDFVSLSHYLLTLQPASSAHLKRLKARAPPSIPSSSPA